MNRILLIAIVVVCGVARPGQAQALRDLEREIAAIECTREDFSVISLMASGRGRDTSAAAQTLRRARSTIDAHFREHPDDAEALVLSTRVDRIMGGCGSWSGRSTDTGVVWIDPPLDQVPLHAALNRALELRPNYAAAHYWKAVLHSTSEPVVRDGEIETEKQLDQAIHHAQRAVALDSVNATYRDLLGTLLTEAARSKEALAVLRPLEGGKHPLYLILRDIDALPLPPGAIVWPATADHMVPDSVPAPKWAGALLFGAAWDASGIGGMAERNLTRTVPLGRIGSWLIPLSKDSLAAFYRSIWPRFTLFPVPDLGGMIVWNVYFELKGNGVQPSSRNPGTWGTTRPRDGLFAWLAEASAQPDSLTGGMPIQTLLIVINYRQHR